MPWVVHVETPTHPDETVIAECITKAAAEAQAREELVVTTILSLRPIDYCG